MTTTSQDPTHLAEEGVEEVAIRSLLNDRLAALFDKDAPRFVSHYDPDVVKFDMAPPLLEAGADVTDPEGWQPWFATWEGPIKVALAHLGMRVSPDRSLAFCHSLNHLTGRKVGGGEVDLWFRGTYCFAGSHDGRWVIVHEHQSTPFYMDGSDRAALDLLPPVAS
jgi:ketosteroid isomerase-like protein